MAVDSKTLSDLYYAVKVSGPRDYAKRQEVKLFLHPQTASIDLIIEKLKKVKEKNIDIDKDWSASPKPRDCNPQANVCLDLREY